MFKNGVRLKSSYRMCFFHDLLKPYSLLSSRNLQSVDVNIIDSVEAIMKRSKAISIIQSSTSLED